MNYKQLSDADIATLLRWYTEAAIKQGEAMEKNDHRAGNRHADIVVAVYRELRDRGREAQMALLDLLKHPAPNVRSWAGTHALEFAPDKGEETLTALTSSEKWFPRISALTTLREWRKGTLRFP